MVTSTSSAKAKFCGVFFCLFCFLFFLPSRSSLTRFLTRLWVFEPVCGLIPYQAYYLAVCCVLHTPQYVQFCRRNRRRAVTLQTLTAILVPFFPAQSTVDAYFRFCWIGKIDLTYAASGVLAIFDSHLVNSQAQLVIFLCAAPY